MAKKLTFRNSVLATPRVANAYRPGVQALTREHARNLDGKQCSTGSIALDDALESSFPDSHRWDYGIGLNRGNADENVLWLEVHHSASGETKEIEKKHAALLKWLSSEAPQLRRLTMLRPIFIWQLSNVERRRNDRRRRNKDAEKFGVVRVEGRLDLSEF